MDRFKNAYRIPTARAQWNDYSDDGFYYITICTAGRDCLFGKIENDIMILSDIGEIVLSEWNKSFEIRRELFCDSFVIMPNHIHAILRIDKNPVNKYKNPNVETHGGVETHAGGVETHAGGVETHAGIVETHAGGVETHGGIVETHGRASLPDVTLPIDFGDTLSNGDKLPIGETSLNGGDKLQNGITSSNGGDKLQNGITSSNDDNKLSNGETSSNGGGVETHGGIVETHGRASLPDVTLPIDFGDTLSNGDKLPIGETLSNGDKLPIGITSSNDDNKLSNGETSSNGGDKLQNGITSSNGGDVETHGGIVETHGRASLPDVTLPIDFGDTLSNGDKLPIGETSSNGGDKLPIGETSSNGGDKLPIGETSSNGGDKLPIGETSSNGGDKLPIGETSSNGGDKLPIGETSSNGGDKLQNGITSSNGGDKLPIGETSLNGGDKLQNGITSSNGGDKLPIGETSLNGGGVETHGGIVETHGRASLPDIQKLGKTGVAYRPPKSISSFVAGFKSSATKRINEYRKIYEPVWQARFHDHIIRTEKEYNSIKYYIETNVLNWINDELSME